MTMHGRQTFSYGHYNIQGAAKKTYHDKNSDFLKTVV